MDVCPFGSPSCVWTSRSACCGAKVARLRLSRIHGLKKDADLLSTPPTCSSSSASCRADGDFQDKGISPELRSARGTCTDDRASRSATRPMLSATLAAPSVNQNSQSQQDLISSEHALDLEVPSPLPRAAREVAAEEAVAASETTPAQSSPYRYVVSRLERSVRLPDSDGAGLVDISCDRRHDNPTLVLMRHGESMWNHLKLFTGDVDIPLTEKGVIEALAGGRSVADIDFSMIFTSRLMRSKQTALLAMTQNKHKGVPVIVRGGFHGKGKTGDANRLRLRTAAAQALKQAECRMIPVFADPALNERCYGDLQGLNKQVAEQTFGKEVVAKWRRSHDTRPPKGESLKDTWERSLKFFMETIEPRLEEGRNVLVVAHGNVLRCLLSYLCNLSEDEMLRLQIGTALPYAFRYEGDWYKHICVKPDLDPMTGEPMFGQPMGLTSAIKRGSADSLI